MKKLFFILLTTLSSALYSSENFTQTQITCEVNSRGIQKIQIITGEQKYVSNPNGGHPVLKTIDPGKVKILYTEGSSESLKPVKGRGGTFEEIIYRDEFFHQGDARVKTYVQVRSGVFGRVQIAFDCNKQNAMSCGSRQPGVYSRTARVAINIRNRVIKRKCSRLRF